MNQYDQTQDLKINVGHCDLYFMTEIPEFYAVSVVLDQMLHSAAFDLVLHCLLRSLSGGS